MNCRSKEIHSWRVRGLAEGVGFSGETLGRSAEYEPLVTDFAQLAKPSKVVAVGMPSCGRRKELTTAESQTRLNVSPTEGF